MHFIGHPISKRLALAGTILLVACAPTVVRPETTVPKGQATQDSTLIVSDITYPLALSTNGSLFVELRGELAKQVSQAGMFSAVTEEKSLIAAPPGHSYLLQVRVTNGTSSVEGENEAIAALFCSFLVLPIPFLGQVTIADQQRIVAEVSIFDVTGLSLQEMRPGYSHTPSFAYVTDGIHPISQWRQTIEVRISHTLFERPTEESLTVLEKQEATEVARQIARQVVTHFGPAG